MVLRVVTVGAVVVGIVARFWTTSPLWLDEALSVNIARLDVPDLLDALRRDGHPPLYYVLLHGWMQAFGASDVAVRALSGVASLVAVPPLWLLARRRFGVVAARATVLVVSITPFAVRYATEARMYALVTALVAWAAWAVDGLIAGSVDGAGRSVDPASETTRINRHAVVLAGCTGALLLTHYWALYLGAVAGLVALWAAVRDHGARRSTGRRVLPPLIVGAALFVPWLPSFLHQAAHTGTPWGTPTRPTRAVVELAGGLGGGESYAEGVLFGFGFLALAAVGAMGVADRDRLVMVPGFGTAARRESVVVVATLALGLAAGLATSSTFVARYAAVVFPLLVLLAGRGLAVVPGARARVGAAAVLVVLGAVGIAFNVVDARTQGAAFAETIEADGEPGDVVAFCPDQLGPSTLRGLRDDVVAFGVPALTRPDRIDWVDYADRNAQADPTTLAAQLIEAAGDGSLWLVHNGSYRTFETLCDPLLAELGRLRPTNGVARGLDADVFENATLFRFFPNRVDGAAGD